MDHGVTSQLVADSQETHSSCTEKMQVPAQYSWSADWSFWVMFFPNLFLYLYPYVYVLALYPFFSGCFVVMN